MAQTYGCRPSELAGIGAPLAAFAFDEAVLAVAGRIHQETQDGASVLQAITRIWGAGRRGERQGRYRSVLAMPGARVRRMKVPESGVW